MIINRVSGSFVLYCIGSSHGCFFLSVSQKGRKGDERICIYGPSVRLI